MILPLLSRYQVLYKYVEFYCGQLVLVLVCCLWGFENWISKKTPHSVISVQKPILLGGGSLL